MAYGFVVGLLWVTGLLWVMVCGLVAGYRCVMGLLRSIGLEFVVGHGLWVCCGL